MSQYCRNIIPTVKKDTQSDPVDTSLTKKNIHVKSNVHNDELIIDKDVQVKSDVVEDGSSALSIPSEVDFNDFGIKKDDSDGLKWIYSLTRDDIVVDEENLSKVGSSFTPLKSIGALDINSWTGNILRTFCSVTCIPYSHLSKTFLTDC